MGRRKAHYSTLAEWLRGVHTLNKYRWVIAAQLTVLPIARCLESQKLANQSQHFPRGISINTEQRETNPEYKTCRSLLNIPFI